MEVAAATTSKKVGEMKAAEEVITMKVTVEAATMMAA
jgi:hypothetical protein